MKIFLRTPLFSVKGHRLMANVKDYLAIWRFNLSASIPNKKPLEMFVESSQSGI